MLQSSESTPSSYGVAESASTTEKITISFVRISLNAKTGPIPCSYSSSNTCPPACKLKEECYGKGGNTLLHWRAIDSGTRGADWKTFCAEVSSLPKGTLWRHNVVGDLPGEYGRIDAKAMDVLIAANRGKRGFTFTHYDPENMHNLECMERATQRGFTVNVSCETLMQSDRVSDLTDLPQVVVLPSTFNAKWTLTPRGRKVVVCPATYQNTTCSRCAICQNASSDRAVIGFPAHGCRKKELDLKFFRSGE